MLVPDLPRTSPERQGIASSALLRFVEALDSQIHDVHSFMLLRHGSVVVEGWWSPYRREHPHMLFSLSNTALGLFDRQGETNLSHVQRALAYHFDRTLARRAS